MGTHEMKAFHAAVPPEGFACASHEKSGIDEVQDTRGPVHATQSGESANKNGLMGPSERSQKRRRALSEGPTWIRV